MAAAPLYDAAPFSFDGFGSEAGQANALELRRDAPLSLRVTLGSEATSAELPPSVRAAVDDYVAFAEELPEREEGGQAPPPADASRRKSAPAALAGALVPDPAPVPRRQALSRTDVPPWCPVGGARLLSRVRSPSLRLHSEIVDFCRFTEPTAAEAASRAEAVQRVREVVTSIWPGAQLEVFGSFATGLYLPTSDIDAVILDSACAVPADGLRALALALTRKGLGRKLQLIAKARIPIVKFEEVTSGFAFDLSFDVANGPAAARWMRAQMQALPPLRPLSLVLKAFLQQRELNEVYTGGVGSYAMVVMLIAHLRTHPACGEEVNLGTLLLDFFELFGRLLNAEAVGVSQDAFFSKAERGWCDERRPDLWAIEDPRDAENDLGRNSYNARAIRSAFDHAHRLLSAPAEERSDSLLARVLHLDAELRGRPRPAGPGAIAAVAASLHAHEREQGRAQQGPAKKRRKAATAAAAEPEEGELAA